jgi:hypothetical protein
MTFPKVALHPWAASEAARPSEAATEAVALAAPAGLAATPAGLGHSVDPEAGEATRSREASEDLVEVEEEVMRIRSQ